MKNLALFDMDGTLTPARKCIEPNMVAAISRLTRHMHVGIVTGSGYEYISEQCADLWKDPYINLDNLTLLPCNGTQKFEWNNNKWECTYEVNMKSEVSVNTYNTLLKKILELQLETIQKNDKLPLSGTFLQYRGSLLNWCMIGRDFSDCDRSKFIKIDKAQNLRKNLINQLISHAAQLNIHNVVAVAGGECSVDIYPIGWDKTYALKHFTKVDNIWFTGDRCKSGGNDHTLYKKIKKTGSAFHIKNPKETMGVIDNIIQKLLFL